MPLGNTGYGDDGLLEMTLIGVIHYVSVFRLYTLKADGQGTLARITMLNGECRLSMLVE